MEFVLQDGHHTDHDDIWTIYSPHHGCPVCMGCIVETLEYTELLPLQRRPALAEMLRLLSQQFTDVMQLFIQEERIVWHIVNILLDNLQLDDEAYVSLSIDTILKLVQQVGSEDLVSAILDHLTHQVKNTTDHKKLLPNYTLLGKLLYQLPPLAQRLLTHYDDLLHELSVDLSSPGETIQSAIAYIFIFLCETSYVPLFSPRLLHQVHSGIVCMLTQAQTLSVQINGLGLLKKLVLHDEGCGMLMSLSQEGSTILTCMKKLLLCKREVLQTGVAQILTLLLDKHEAARYGAAILESDIAEFLFETLHTQNTVQMESILKVLQKLSCVDHFYKRCHAVYGIESVLHALTTALEINNPNLQLQGYTLLTEILKRQPSDMPLFVSPTVVQKCLCVIKSGLVHHQSHVQMVAVKALTAILRKDHLLIPVPFKELTEMVTMISSKLYEQLRDPHKSAPQKKTRNKKKVAGQKSGDEVLDSFIDLMLNSCKLAVECRCDRATCESNFSAPGTAPGVGQEGSTIQMFVLALLHMADDTCLPLIMIHWDAIQISGLHEKCLRLVCDLQDLDPMVTGDLVYKMVTAGFLTSVLDIAVTQGGSNLIKLCGQFLHLAIVSCQTKGLLPKTLSMDTLECMQHVHCRVGDVARMFVDQDVTVDTVQTYLLVLYVSYIHNERVLSSEDLQCVLSTTLESHTSLTQLSPFTRKCYLYLLAFACVHEGVDMRKCIPNGVQCIPSILREDEASWYTHDIIMLQWCFMDIVIASILGETMLRVYLEHTSTESLHQYLDNESEDMPGTEEGRILLHLCDGQQFIDCLLNLLAVEGGDTVTKLLLLLEVYTHYMSCDQAGEVTPDTQEVNDTWAAGDGSGEVILEPTESMVADNENKGKLDYVKAKVTEIIQKVFLKNYTKATDVNVVGLLKVLLTVNKYLTTDGAIDVKVLYHVLSQLSRSDDTSDDVTHICMLTVLAAISTTQNTDNQVCALVVQNEAVMYKISNYIAGDNDSLYCISCDIVTALLQQHNIKSKHPLSLDVCGLVHTSCRGNGDDVTSSLGLLAALFSINLSSSVIKVLGRINTNQYRTLYIHLQQMAVQDLTGVCEMAVHCMEKLLQYLYMAQPDLGVELLRQPWNKTLLDVVLDTCTETRINECHLSLFCMFTSYSESRDMLTSSPSILKRLVQCCRQFTQNSTSRSAELIRVKDRLFIQMTKNFKELLTEDQMVLLTT